MLYFLVFFLISENNSTKNSQDHQVESFASLILAIPLILDWITLATRSNIYTNIFIFQWNGSRSITIVYLYAHLRVVRGKRRKFNVWHFNDHEQMFCLFFFVWKRHDSWESLRYKKFLPDECHRRCAVPHTFQSERISQ